MKNFNFSLMKAFGVAQLHSHIVSFCDAGGCDAASDCDGGSQCDENA